MACDTLRHAATTVATGCRLNKYEPSSSKKTSDVTGPPFKDKSNQSEHNVLPPKSAKMKTKTETKQSVMPEDVSKDAEIAKRMAALELREAEVKVKEDKIARMEMAQQADSEEERGGSYHARCPSTPSSLYGVKKVASARGPTWHPFHQLLSSQLQASMSKIGSQSTK